MSGLSVIHTPSRPVALSDRYELAEGRVLLSGVQALVRLLLDQHRADARAGMRSATLVSGYQGSPLGGFDKEVARLGPLAAAHHVVHRPAVNEELGATAVWGSQLAGTLPRPRYDGVLGVWYGKSPGVDRSADAIRHGNLLGTDPRGGVLALVGDDPACKSSTVPGASEELLAALHVPVLAPGSVQEALDLGRHAIACSRASGLWAALKVVTAVADASATAAVGIDRVQPRTPLLEWEGAPYVHRPTGHLLAPQSVELERTLTPRLELAKLYARLNGLNAVTHDAPGARLGVVVHGSARHELQAALTALGFGEGTPAPLRLLEIGMLFPLDEQAVRDFAAGLDEIVVVEEKGPFLERLVRDALYGSGATPPVLGKRDERGAPLLAAHGTLDADAIARALGARLLARAARGDGDAADAPRGGAPAGRAPAADLAAVRARLELLDAVAARPVADLGAQRTPAFCSGCPHSVSTKAPDDAIVGAGIGCHTMVLLDTTNRGAVAGITQMGGEGVQWVGAAPFAERRHFVQNLGDGTFHHSGSLAIRAAVAAGIDVTYKLLCNGTVAMTGGQDVEGQLPVPALVRSLAAEGVARIVVTAEDLSRYDGVDLGPRAELRPRSELDRTQRELAKVEGVTVLIHDQACAAELRRARKRGLAPAPKHQVVINERVCEGCGDCGEKSACLSVEPVATEFGRKTRINQDSCNSDLTCLEGDCPSFLTVTPPRAPKKTKRKLPAPPALPEPTRIAADDVRLRLVGIGGTGVVTVSQVLAMAALLDGRHSRSLDQTGLSQKAGPVVSDVRIATAAPEGGASAAAGGLDLLLGFDLLGAASAANLRAADRARTLAVVATDVVPTARMVRDVDAPAADVTAATGAIDAVTRAADNVYLDAHALARELFESDSSANVLVLGAAWQSGAIPLTRAALHEAFRVNGAAVERNVAAFEWGRACVAAPEAVAALRERHADGARAFGGLRGGRSPAPAPSARERALIAQAAPAGSELERLLQLRVADLSGWGGRAVAARYATTVADVARREQAALPGSSAVAEAVARNLHRVLAYKDEYEVARLHVAAVAELPRGTRAAFHLHPPALRALGMRRKLRLGGWFLPALRLLAHGRRLRGTPLDPFGRAEVRRVERALPGEYLELVDGALARLTPATLALALEAAELPELVRGYEEIKLRGVARFRARAQELRTELDADTEARPPAAPQSDDEERER